MPIAIATLSFALAALVLVHAAVYFAQERLIFLPRPLDERVRAALRQAVPDAEPVDLPTADGHRLRGWFVPNGAPARRAPVVLYFGGNAEAVSSLALEAGELRGLSLVLVNYRGYGESTGEPGEQALFSDALAVYDHVASLPRVDRSRIVVMGRSLGSGVATYVASRRPVAAVVLVTPFDSMAAVAHTHYPFLWVGPLLRHPFDSAALAPGIDAPMLAIIAGADTVIPPRHARALVKAWRGRATSIVLPAAGHNDVSLQAPYWPTIRSFLLRLGANPGSPA